MTYHRLSGSKDDSPMATDRIMDNSGGWWSGIVDVSRMTTSSSPPNLNEPRNDLIFNDFNEQMWNASWSSAQNGVLGAQEVAREVAQTQRFDGNGLGASLGSQWQDYALENGMRKTKMQTGCIPCLYVVKVKSPIKTPFS